MTDDEKIAGVSTVDPEDFFDEELANDPQPFYRRIRDAGGVVEGPLGEHCRVELIKDGVLIVSVPSGAFAQQIVAKSPTILRGFSSLGKGAPSSLRTVLR